jgi:signal transduction histidine kinase
LQNRGVVVELDLDEELVLPEETEQVVYRCTQEALRNVLLHARADLVRVGLHAGEGAVVLTVRDDGVGMPTVVTDSPMGHLGLRSLRDLAVECRGVLSIETAPGQGTEIRLELPS